MSVMRYRRKEDGSLEYRTFLSEAEIESGWVKKAEALNPPKEVPKKRGRKPKELEVTAPKEELNLDDDNA